MLTVAAGTSAQTTMYSSFFQIIYHILRKLCWQCSQYCEVKTSWFFGPEISFDVTCESGDPSCPITQSAGVSVTNEHSFNVGFNIGNKKRDGTEASSELSARDDPPTPTSPLDYITAAFTLGASWTWSNTSTSGTASTNNKPQYAVNECGYWYVPSRKREIFLRVLNSRFEIREGDAFQQTPFAHPPRNWPWKKHCWLDFRAFVPYYVTSATSR